MFSVDSVASDLVADIPADEIRTSAMHKTVDPLAHRSIKFRKTTVPKGQNHCTNQPNHCTKTAKTRFQELKTDRFVTITSVKDRSRRIIHHREHRGHRARDATFFETNRGAVRIVDMEALWQL